MNKDLAKERQSSSLRVQQLNSFIGRNLFLSDERYKQVLALKSILGSQIKSLYEENYENLERGQKYELVLKKSLELIEFANEHNVTNYMEYTYLIGEVMGTEKHLFGLHFTMFTISLELWSTPDQKAYWDRFLKENGVFGTYIQTEIGHGTFIRGLETTATYDRNNQEFIIDSPTLTSIKFWPGASGKTCNYAIVMAKLIIDDKEYGIHAFVVQLRSLDNHSPVPGIEMGDIGKKHAYEAIDNGFVKFNNVRIPRNNMLMRFAQVLPNGEFKQLGNEIVMYACMLIMRGILCMFASLLHSISTTIAIRYSCVRRQTADPNGLEPQIIDYQTQQYRLLPGLATTYANFFATINFRNILNTFKKQSNNFSQIDANELAKLHALSSGIKSMVFDECLKFGQINRLCCGGHGYSASSGLQPVIQEADAGCTYEGDNIVLYLQTARYLLKAVHKGFSPHLHLDNLSEIKTSKLFKRFENYIVLFENLYENQIGDISGRMISLIEEQNLDRFEAWNSSSVALVETSKIYINLFIIYMNLNGLYEHHKSECPENQIILEELFELYLTYGIVEKFSNHFLKLGIIDGRQMTEHQNRFYELLKKVRLNAVCLVDAFGWSDSNLASSLGVYDGNVYEKLFQFAKDSLFNQNLANQTFKKVARPYIQAKSKL